MNKMRSAASMLCLWTALGASFPAVAGDRMQAGLWEMALPGAAKPMKQCWTADDVKGVNGSAANFQSGLEKVFADMGAGWKVKDVKLQGDTLSYTVILPGGKTRPVTATYHGDTYESTTPEGLTKARRVGPCP